MVLCLLYPSNAYANENYMNRKKMYLGNTLSFLLIAAIYTSKFPCITFQQRYDTVDY